MILEKLSIINNINIIYDNDYSLHVREYYFYCVNLFKKILSNKKYNKKIYNTNFIFGDSGYYQFNINNNKNIKIDIQYEHTLVKPNGRDSAGSIVGNIKLINGSDDKYLVRINNYEYYNNDVDIIIDYSLPNLINIKESNLYNNFYNKTLYIVPLIYDINFNLKNKDKNNNIITLFTNHFVPRRHNITNILENEYGVKISNYNNYFNNELIRLYDDTKILLNVHQTDHHDTFEELRVLPALMRGVIVVSEIVPLKESIPYHEFIIWSNYEDLPKTIIEVNDNYEYYRDKIFNGLNLMEKLNIMKINNQKETINIINKFKND